MTTSPKRTIPAGEFKARCLKLMDEVAATGGEIVVTKRGKPLVRLTAVEPADAPKSIYGCMKGTIKVVGDIMEPFDVEYEAIDGNIFPEEPKAKKTKRKRA
jgi:prevent-host-death family protein